MPTFNTVSIIPGIESLAPERTETNNGLFTSPNFLPLTFSKLERASCIWLNKSFGTVPVDKNSRHASVVMVNPGGTGNPICTISAILAPLPPSKSDLLLSPNVNGYTNCLANLTPNFY